MMYASIVVTCVAGVVAILWWTRRARDLRLIRERTISSEELRLLLDADRPPKVFDVRLPLDLLAYAEIIPGAVRLVPKEVIANPSLIPKDEDAVVYCTCPGTKTSLEILHKAAALDYSRMRILRGGLAEWKSRGYPVASYDQVFHLDTPS